MKFNSETFNLGDAKEYISKLPLRIFCCVESKSLFKIFCANFIKNLSSDRTILFWPYQSSSHFAWIVKLLYYYLKISHISNKKQHVDNWKEYLAIRTILWAEEQLLFQIKSKSAKENLVPGFPAADRCLWTKRFIDGGRKGRKMVILIMWLCCVLDHS